MGREHATLAPHRNPVALWAVGILTLAVYAPTALWLGHRWSLGVWFHSHGWAVPPIMAWLIYNGLQRVKTLPVEGSAWGFVFLIPAAILQVVDALLGFELLSAVSLALAVPGLSFLLLGKRRTKAIWFGLFFVVFAVPIPLVLVRMIHLGLRRIAAVGTEHVLSWMSYDVTREATHLQIGPESIQIADACSGFATLMALSMAGILMVYMGRGSPMRRLAVVALIFPIAAIANVFRCVLLCMVVLAFDTGVLNTWIHPASGIAAFIIALLMLQGAMALLMPERAPAEEAAS